MNPKTLQCLMGHSDIGVTLNTYTPLGLEDAAEELRRVEEPADARKELEKVKGKNPVLQKMICCSDSRFFLVILYIRLELLQ